MKRIHLDQATEGMRLTKAVESESGMLLYGEGMELSKEIINKLRSLQIEYIWVEGESEPRIKKDEYKAIVERAFQKVEEDPLMKEIKKIFLEHLESLYE